VPETISVLFGLNSCPERSVSRSNPWEISSRMSLGRDSEKRMARQRPIAVGPLIKGLAVT
jgi:hypothetical protein